MFGFIRILIGCLFFGGMILINKKCKKERSKKRKQYLISAIVAILVCYVLEIIPFENAIITFSSPESVYKYVTLGNSCVKMVISGENSDLVIGGCEREDTYLIVPKETNGWKIGTAIGTKRIRHILTDGIIICVYQYMDTSDYYITVFNAEGGPVEITDFYDSEFLSWERYEEKLDMTYVTYCAYVPNFDEEYWIEVNNEKIVVD